MGFELLRSHVVEGQNDAGSCEACYVGRGKNAAIPALIILAYTVQSCNEWSV